VNAGPTGHDFMDNFNVIFGCFIFLGGGRKGVVVNFVMLMLSLVKEIMQKDFINCNNCKINSKNEVGLFHT
jgi:hypothetical protein